MTVIVRWSFHLIAAVLIVLAAGCGGGGTSSINSDPSTTGINAQLAGGAQLVDKGPAGKTGSAAPADLIADWTWDLIAGQTLMVGTVHITNDSDNFYAEYQIDPALPDEWLIHQVHVYIGTVAPPANGAPGQFTFIDDAIEPGVTNYVATIPFSDVFGANEPGKGQIYVAVHAVVCTGGDAVDPAGVVCETAWGGSNGTVIKGKYQWTLKWNKKWGGYFTTSTMPVPELPADWITYKASHMGTYSYWNIVFQDPVTLPPGSFLTGSTVNWVGWCVDKFHSMYSGLNYEVKLYSTYDPNLPALAQHGNWDLVNFMINQRRNPATGGPFAGKNWTDNNNKLAFQEAVWYFTDGVATANALSQQFIAYAQANGENFIPNQAGQYYAIVLFPDTSTNNNAVRAQMNVIEVDP